MKTQIHTLDLNFLGISNAIAAYAIPHPHGVILIESGPGSTLTGLEAGLAKLGFTPADVTDVLITHIHLDHAGAAGWLAHILEQRQDNRLFRPRALYSGYEERAFIPIEMRDHSGEDV